MFIGLVRIQYFHTANNCKNCKIATLLNLAKYIPSLSLHNLSTDKMLDQKIGIKLTTGIVLQHNVFAKCGWTNSPTQNAHGLLD